MYRKNDIRQNLDGFHVILNNGIFNYYPGLNSADFLPDTANALDASNEILSNISLDAFFYGFSKFFPHYRNLLFMQHIKLTHYTFDERKKSYRIFIASSTFETPSCWKFFKQERHAKAFLVDLSKRYNELLEEINSIYTQVVANTQGCFFTLRGNASAKYNRIKSIIDERMYFIAFRYVSCNSYYPKCFMLLARYIFDIIQLVENEDPYFAHTGFSRTVNFLKSALINIMHDITAISAGDMSPRRVDVACDIVQINNHLNHIQYEQNLWNKNQVLIPFA